MLREKIASMEKELRSKNQKISVYDEKLKFYGANVQGTKQHNFANTTGSKNIEGYNK